MKKLLSVLLVSVLCFNLMGCANKLSGILPGSKKNQEVAQEEVQEQVVSDVNLDEIKSLIQENQKTLDEINSKLSKMALANLEEEIEEVEDELEEEAEEDEEEINLQECSICGELFDPEQEASVYDKKTKTYAHTECLEKQEAEENKVEETTAAKKSAKSTAKTTQEDDALADVRKGILAKEAAEE